MNFRELVEAKMGDRTYREVADDCGISYSHLYNLMCGKCGARPRTARSIAKGLKTLGSRVLGALKQTRADMGIPEPRPVGRPRRVQP